MSRKTIFPNEICPNEGACSPKARFALHIMPYETNNEFWLADCCFDDMGAEKTHVYRDSPAFLDDFI